MCIAEPIYQKSGKLLPNPGLSDSLTQTNYLRIFSGIAFLLTYSKTTHLFNRLAPL